MRPALAILAAGLAAAQSSPDAWRTYQDPAGRFTFQYPDTFGEPSAGTDNGFGSRTASIRFSERIIQGGEAVVTSGPPQVDLQAVGGLYDAIALQIFPVRIAAAIRKALPVLTAKSFCDALRREQHLDPANASLSALTTAQRNAIPVVDRMGNFKAKVLSCEITAGTVTFDKQTAHDPTGSPRHIYGAIRFLPPPYSSFQLIRGTSDAPGAQMLRQITTVVNSWKASF